MEIVRVESWERRVVLLVSTVGPALVTWFFIADRSESVIRVLAALGSAAVAVLLIFIWSVFKLPAVMEAEQQQQIENLQAEKETAETIKYRRETLGTLLHNANQIAKMYLTDQPLSETIEIAQQWKNEAGEFAQSYLDEAHKALLWSDAGITIGSPHLPQAHEGRRLWMTYRAIRIQEIIKTL